MVDFNQLDNPEYLETTEILRIVVKRGDKVSKTTCNLVGAASQTNWCSFFLGGERGKRSAADCFGGPGLVIPKDRY